MKKVLTMIGCGASYLAAAFFAFFEVVFIVIWIEDTRYLMRWGAEGSPRVVEEADAAGIFAVMTAIPLLLLLALAIYLTRTLWKQRKAAGYGDDSTK